MYKQPNHIDFVLPDWLESFASTYTPNSSLEQRMEFVIAAAQKNIEEHTGGPFSAAVFEIGTGKLVSLGVNLVTTQGLSILHAEMIALSIAQRKLDSYTLAGDNMADHELLTSTEPCAMCFGAIPWSGVKHVATAATDPDARKIGFDEGAKPGDWVGALENRNIRVTTEVNREKARLVLQLYSQAGKTIYN